MSTTPIRIAIADDHAIIRDGLGRILGAEPDLRIAAIFADSGALLAAIAAGGAAAWDVVILDLEFPPGGGWDALDALIAARPELAVLVYTRLPEERFGARAHAAGAAGYLSKEWPTSRMIEAIRIAHLGDYYTADRPAVANERAAPWEPLSEQELRIAELYATGQPTGQIADQLGVRPGTVSTYLRRVRTKLGLDNNHAILVWARDCGLVA